MAFKLVAVGVLSLMAFVGCNQDSNMKTNGQPDPTHMADKIEVFSLYKKADSKIYVARALSVGNDKVDLYLYELNTSSPEGAKQSFVSVQHLIKQEIDNKKSELQIDYNWEPFKGNKVLFVQIEPAGFKNEIELLEKRQEIEEKLGNALESKSLGKWFSGDLGPGGGNMLFTVEDIDKSMDLILEVLRQNELDGKVRIGRRVLIDKDDWFYEVIHPTRYSGDFNTM